MNSLELIGCIYEYALDAGGLRQLAELLTQYIGAESGLVGLVRRGSVFDAATFNQSQQALDQYAAHYSFINPLDPLMRGIGSMQVARNSDLMDEAAYRNTEFYNDFARIHDSARIMGSAMVPITADIVAHVGVHRPGFARQFSDAHARRLEGVLGHVQRALQLRTRVGILPPDALGLEALDRLPLACIICDRNGLVVFANPAAERLAGETSALVMSGPDGLAAAAPSGFAGLRALIRDAAVDGRGSQLTLTAPAGDRLFVLVTPLPHSLGERSGHCLVTVRSTHARPPPRFPEDLMSLFGLTPAEARLAASLAAGNSLAQIRAGTGVAESTLRSQLGSIFRKTEVSGQRELVSLLALLLPR